MLRHRPVPGVAGQCTTRDKGDLTLHTPNLRLSVLALALASFSAPAAPPALPLSGAVEGEITRGSELNHNDGSRSTLYRLQLDAGQAVELSLDGPLAGALSVFRNDLLKATSISGGGSELLFRGGDAGEYIVAVSGADATAFGPFRLAAQPVEAHDGSPLRDGARITDWYVGTPASFELQVDSRGLYRVLAESSTFDTLLRLEGEGISVMDDDGCDALNACLELPLQPGNYRLQVDAGSPGEGAFQLSVNASPLPAGALEDGAALVHGTPLQVYVQGDGRRVLELTLPSPSLVTLDARGPGFDPILQLSGAGLVATDDDGGAGTDARMRIGLQAGSYQVEVGDVRGRGGLAEVAVEVNEVSAVAWPELVPGRTFEGQLEAGMRDVYRVAITRAGEYEIQMRAPGDGIDGVLILGRDGAMVARADDDQGSLDPRLVAQLQPGEYVLVVQAFSADHGGSYTLDLRRL